MDNNAPDDGQQKEGFVQEAVSTSYKITGWQDRIGAVIDFIIGTIATLLGLLLAVVFRSFFFLIISVFGVLIFLAGVYYWKRSKSLVKGKFD